MNKSVNLIMLNKIKYVLYKISFSTGVFTGGLKMSHYLVENEGLKKPTEPKASMPPVY